MYKIKLTKRNIKNHDGSMTIDANFNNGNEAFNRSFVLPINSTELEIHTEVKGWLEGYEESIAVEVDPKKEIDVSKIKTGRTERKEYEQSKAELAEYIELVALGAMDSNDKKITDKQAEVKSKHKEGYKRER